MKALKGNKVYTIGEPEKAHYIALGFDIQDDEGNTIAYGRGKTVPYEKYVAIKQELDELKAQTETDESGELSGMSLDELKAYAEVHQIDLGNATSQAGILKKIKEARQA